MTKTQSKSQHTPGPPWTLNKGNRKPMIGFDVKDGGPLLPIVPEVHGYCVAEAKRNARLIAAAPDLLAALKDLDDRLQLCKDVGVTADEAYDSFYQEIVRAAIAKATGAA